MSLFHLGRARGPWGSVVDLYSDNETFFVIVTDPSGQGSSREDFTTQADAERFMDDCDVINGYTTGWQAVLDRLMGREEKPEPGAEWALTAASQLPIGTEAWLETYKTCLQLYRGARNAH